jgi:hypothetical protein
VEEGFLLGSGIFKNYYNWTMRYASRLRIFADLPRHLKLITPPLRKPHVGGSLAFHNIRRGRTVQVGGRVIGEAAQGRVVQVAPGTPPAVRVTMPDGRQYRLPEMPGTVL